jgi:hypothetical protein
MMSKWFEKADAKQLLVWMFGVIIVLMLSFYTKDNININTKLDSSLDKKDLALLEEKMSTMVKSIKAIADDVTTIKDEQKKDNNKFNAKLEKAEFIFETKDNVLEERIRAVENKVAVIRGEPR